MPNALQIVKDLADFLITSVEVYSESDEGKAELAGIISDLENLPLDSQGNPQPIATSQAATLTAIEADFLRLHPEQT